MKSRLQRELHAYLEQASADYGKSPRIREIIDAWERLLPTYAEKLRAFARELREAVHAVQHHANTAGGTYERRIRALAQLRFAALSVDTAAGQMAALSQRIAQTGGILFACTVLPDPPLVRQTDWTDHTIKLPDPDMVLALGQAESAVRGLLASEFAALRSHVAHARNLVDDVAYQYLEHYWSQLRAHAQAHYVSESDVDEVLARLEDRYIAAAIRERMNDLTAVADPYGFAR